MKSQLQLFNELPSELQEHIVRFRQNIRAADKLLENGEITDAELSSYFTLHYLIMASNPHSNIKV